MSPTGTRTAAPWTSYFLLTFAPVSRPMISVPFERYRIQRVADAGRQAFSRAAHARDEARPSVPKDPHWRRSEEHTSELQSLMRISYAVFCLKKKTKQYHTNTDKQ